MTPLFVLTIGDAALIRVIQTGDLLVHEDTISFLRGQLLLWRGMWDPSDLRALSSGDPIADQLMKDITQSEETL